MLDDAESRFVKLYDEIEKNYTILSAIIPEECSMESSDSLFEECKKFVDNDLTYHGYIHSRDDHDKIMAFLNCCHARVLIENLNKLTEPGLMKDWAVQLAMAHSYSSFIALRAFRNSIDDQKKAAQRNGHEIGLNMRRAKFANRNENIERDVKELWKKNPNLAGNNSGTAAILLRKKNYKLSQGRLAIIIKNLTLVSERQ